MSTVSPPKHPSKRADKAKALRDRITESLETLAKAVDDVRASATFKRFLDVQAKFHRYSWRNTLLIAMQRPEASQVAGYRAWQKLKRQVRAGEHGIMIFAPCPWKREATTDNGGAEEAEGVYFRAVHVFDIAQTDGEELPSVEVPTVESVADGLLSDLVELAASRNITVKFAEIPGGAFGVSKRGSVDIDNRHPTGQQAKSLAHELAHEAMHWDVTGPITRNIAELEAESVAYVVCSHFGLDVEVRASRYIALWDGDGKGLRESMKRISDTARGIIDGLESKGTKGVAA